ncbi:sensor histidine kinase [uncultured Subdoligranulum sp.]|uniref:cache domain-containing sensor histidine kinase n=1 Tax=uncultured Subdoligranulum sp. TaxID=512298 RepID=UPI0025D77D46|nr:sensor histidine kinase [uncultured Subdoligranulum sp.]
MSRRPRITTILVTMVVGMVAVILVCCIGLFLDRYRRAIVQNARTSSAQAVTQVSNTVASYLEDMDQAMDSVTQTLGQSAARRDSMLEAFLNFRPDVVAVTSYDGAGNLLDCWAQGRDPKEKIAVNLSFDYDQARRTADSFMTAPHVETIFDRYYPWVVTMTARLDEGGEAAWVSLDLSFSSLSSYINNVGIGTRGYCFLLDAGGNIIYHPQQQLIYSGLKSEDTAALAALEDGVYDNGTVITCVNSVEDSGWRVVGVSYVDELVDRNMAEMMQLSALLGALVLGGAVLTSWLLSRLLGRPLRGLAAAMESFEKDADHFTYHPVGGTREVQELSASFSHMVGRIQQLMVTVRQEEVNLRKTELKALQAQINPHFLYNTLDSIAWMCEQGQNADAVRMVHALARLFRISISKGHELIPIAREIEHAESYLQIQKYRYKNRFTYHFEVDPGCLDYLCNKITLQPIIENAINHGLDLMVEEGHITVQVCPDGQDILFRVRDDGVGMTPEQVAAILNKGPSDRTGIGIKNVNDRLKIYFGKQYGLRIDSVPDEGTCVEIRMPKVRQEDGYETK